MLWLMLLQNAVVDRIHSTHPLSSKGQSRVRSRARILRRIRIASLMHGVPEAIPLWGGRPMFLPANTGQDLCPMSLDWESDTVGRHSPLFCLPGIMRDGCARKLRLLDRLDIILILEKPQLEALLGEIAPLLTLEVSGTVTLPDIDQLLRTAIQSGQPVLLRQWWKRRAKRKRPD